MPLSCDSLQQLECGSDGRCVRVGDGREGSRCVPGFNFDGLCDAGLFCDRSGETPTCRRQLDLGAMCRAPIMCLSGACRGDQCVARLCD